MQIGNQSGKLFPMSTSLPSYGATNDLARIAKAPNKMATKLVISSIRASIKQLKLASEDSDRANKLVRQAEGVLLKAQRKVRNLEKEEQMERSAQRAEEQKKEERAAQIRLLLQEKRTKRKSREHGQIQEGHDLTFEEAKREHKQIQKWTEDPSYGLQSYLAGPASLPTDVIAGDLASVGAVIHVIL